MIYFRRLTDADGAGPFWWHPIICRVIPGELMDDGQPFPLEPLYCSECGRSYAVWLVGFGRWHGLIAFTPDHEW